ncbi:hypothetical protein QWY28_14930 [Nocardioides sp. SOB77]|uniref:DUF1772 domain-containing protein n=1 Tax=Nocardioides oceani TaxID=3058369 RepID=A0ABT8FHT7_9ACTN|nr:hypothetical protein [Nocardioides oceani]MDN4174256.1 hypothetical protein [Nocardioides oceani]
MPTTPEALLLGATALHAGFQLTVTTLVYPRLADTPAADWRRVHERHGRTITPLVAVVYAAVLAACGWALADPGPAVVAAASACGLALGTTAARAAPLHGRLADRPDPRLLARLLAVDRVRAVAAVAAVPAALAAAVG